MSHLGRRPVSAMTTLSLGQMQADGMLAEARIESANPDNHWGLGVAVVVEIDYEELFVTLRLLTGASGPDERLPIPLTFPGAGNRHFMGALPEIGDVCICGWMPQESLRPKDTKIPVILGWIVNGAWTGRDWLTTSPFGPHEMDLASKREQDVARGLFDRVRHKLRHGQPGNILQSSAQGADLVLDESVTLANRRGNEFILRDQDQAAVTRALQRFDALAGVRAYHGMVQRDARTLAAHMVSDGKVWDGGLQARGDDPIPERAFPEDTAHPAGMLTPAKMLDRPFLASSEGAFLGPGVFKLADNLDPYAFLLRGGLINEAGFVVDPGVESSAVYGGKDIYRVAAQSNTNAAKDPGAPTLTEYRVEVTHTTTGRLPVTEQTDGFDAERLPSSDPESPGGTKNPFIEWVLGSVVGNDPYTELGRASYGLPVVTSIFDGDVPAPRIIPVPLTVAANSDAGPVPIEEQAATLFRLTPLDSGPQTFWSVNKKGQLRASIGGPLRENSVEAALRGGLKLSLGGPLNLLMDGGVSLGTNSKQSLHLHSEGGPVTIYGGGPVTGPESAGARLSAKQGESDLPSVDIQARKGIRLKAGTKVHLKGAIVESQCTSHRVRAQSDVDVTSGGRIGISAETLAILCTGKKTENFSGPKNFLPTSGALHEQTYTPAYPGLTAKKTTITWGDREENLLLGNHTTSILIGNATYETNLGILTMRGTTTQVNLGPAGMAGTALVGNVTLTATAGAATMTGLASVLVAATAGVATVRGALGVNLSGPIYGPDSGPLLCSGSIEPFSGLPYSVWGAGAKGHLIVP